STFKCIKSKKCDTQELTKELEVVVVNENEIIKMLLQLQAAGYYKCDSQGMNSCSFKFRYCGNESS
ncbi:hypothetical protein PSY81_23450, partial [Shigella flexneri]|nr:hypothetical protein [Shigella flexneri]